MISKRRCAIMKRAASSIICGHYGVKSVTAEEIKAEIVNLKRRRAAGTLDDFSEKLCAALVNAGHIPVYYSVEAQS